MTFDAEHPDRRSRPGVQELVLDRLDELGVRATFFIQGRWAEAYPQTARRIAEGGHLVGNHSHYHARMFQLNDEGLAWDLRTAERAIVEATGVDPKPWFRCPFGAGADDPRVLAAIEAAGYRHVGWTVEGLDYEPDRPVEQLQRLVVDGVMRKPDEAIVLLHTWPHRTEAALPAIVGQLRDAGAQLVGVDELATVEALPAPEPNASWGIRARRSIGAARDALRRGKGRG